MPGQEGRGSECDAAPSPLKVAVDSVRADMQRSDTKLTEGATLVGVHMFTDEAAGLPREVMRSRERGLLETAILEPLSQFAGEAAGICLPPNKVMPTTELMAAAQRAASRIVDVIYARNAVVIGVEREVDQDDADYARLGRSLVAILQCHCGERGGSEGAVATLHRIVLERERSERKLAELDPEIVKRVSAEMRLRGKG
jgi:hypothetical protein